MKLKKLFFLQMVLLLSGVILFTSCGTQQRKKDKGTPSTGSTSEILVASGGTLWESYVGDSIRSFLKQPYQVLPQREPSYQVAHIPNKDLNKDIFRTHHNILIINTDTAIEKPFVRTRKNRYSNPQQIIEMNANDWHAFLKLWDKNKKTVKHKFDQNELKRLNNTFSHFRDIKIINKLMEKHDLTLTVPESFYIAKNNDQFIWLRKETKEISQGIIIFYHDYTDTLSFDRERIMWKLDSITKRHIPGPSKGSYMALEREFKPPIAQEVSFNGKYAMQLRGLWKTENDFMGGPFVSYTLVDERKNRLVTAYGYVYAPKDDKRNFTRQVDAILHALRFKEKQKE